MQNIRKLRNHRKLQGFTLVELIVVITILVILGTIAFLQLGGFAGSARDSTRVSDMTNIANGLNLFQIKSGSYPAPSGTTVSYTGGNNGSAIIVQGTLNGLLIGFSQALPFDPNTKIPYTYSILGGGGYYQIASELENPLSRMRISPLIEQTYADGPKTALVKGSYISDPSLPSLIVIPASIPAIGSGGIFSPDVCFVTSGSFTNTLSAGTGTCIKKKDSILKSLDTSLVGYWDMETTFNSGGIDYLKDLSGNGNDGVFSGGMIANTALTGGIVGKGMSFNGDNYIFAKNVINKPIGKELGISLTMIIKPKYNSNNRIRDEHIFSNGTGEGGTGSIFLKSRICCERDIIFYAKKDYVDNLDTDGTVWYRGRGVEWDYNELSSNNYYLLTLNINYDGTLAIFSNGIKIVQSFEGGVRAGPYKNPSDLYIGNILSNINNGFMGIIDDVKIYNRSLSNDEIKQQAKAAGF